jgi:hypothetical protein
MINPMFRVQDVLLSDDVATARFACQIHLCMGACCVVGDAGAPVHKKEIPHLEKAFRQLKNRLHPDSVETALTDGVTITDSKGQAEISCRKSGECIFVVRNQEGAAICAIQDAYFKGETDWEKPISCHLYPLRVRRVSGMDLVNYEYLPELCSTACDHGTKKGIWLADFLQSALTRRYGADWYAEFQEACTNVRERYGAAT